MPSFLTLVLGDRTKLIFLVLQAHLKKHFHKMYCLPAKAEHLEEARCVYSIEHEVGLLYTHIQGDRVCCTHLD